MKLSNLLLLLPVVSLVSAEVSQDIVADSDSLELEHSSVSKFQELFHENGLINLQSLKAQLDELDLVKYLNNVRLLEAEGKEESYIEWVFERLFPFGPAANALLATAYISGPPNFILALIPASIKPSSLSYLVSFAIGGLLGDVFLHLLPQTFLGEPLENTVDLVLVDPKRNTVLGLFIFIGFTIFFIIDKSLRILEHSGEGSHSHGHSHTHSEVASSNDVEIIDKESSSLRNRKTGKAEPKDEPVISEPNASTKTSAYLNLISDFTHNITDGLAIASSFYISKSVGSTTTLAVFFHEIPHEIGDFALLIQGGFTKWQAMNSQFVTAIGAFLGTFIGIGIQSLAASTTDVDVIQGQSSYAGLYGTSVEIGDLTLPFTAGGFLYIATVGVIPEILELGERSTRGQEIRKGLVQLCCIFVGISIMFLISWLE